MTRSILIAGPPDNPDLAGSYGRAFRALGHHVSEFDLEAAIDSSVRAGQLGKLAHKLAPREAWIQAGNRQLVVAARLLRPDVIIIPGSAPVRPGALAQIRVSLPAVKIVLLWPDPLLNLATSTIQALPVYHCVASCSGAQLPLLRQLGAQHAIWIRFAADDELLPGAGTRDIVTSQDNSDVTFIGSHRPERERAIEALVQAGLSVKLVGNDSWKKYSKNRKVVRSCLIKKTVRGKDYYDALARSGVVLNVIDDTSYPAANMRAFEAAACGVPVLCSGCPELSDVFLHMDSMIYYEGDTELVDLACRLTRDPQLRSRIGESARRIVLQRHLYRHRAIELLEHLDLR